MTGYRVSMAGLVVALAKIAAAQAFPFELLVTQGQNAVTVQNGSTLAFLAAVGQTQTAQIEATYNGTGQATISSQPTLFGSSAFKVTVTSMLPALLTPGQNLMMMVTFTPTSAAATTAEINLPFIETQTNGTSSSSAITLGLDGTSPSFVLSYSLQSNQNVVPLQNGGLIPFPATLVGTTAEAALNVTNTGSGIGTLTGISVSGAAFTLQGIPLLPASVGSGQTIAILVLYTPSGVNLDSGQITITLGTGAPVTIGVSGNGTSPTFSYQILTTPPTAVAAGGTISLPDTQVGQSSTVTIQVTNAGNASGTVSSLSVAGPGFALSNAPVLPQTLAVGSSVTFAVSFSPTQPGSATGTLIVNSNTFQLSGNGLGSSLTYSYVAGGSSITLSSTNNSVVFSPVQITQSGQLSFDIKNTGTVAATISNIGVGQANGPFTLTGLPALPVTLAPNADFHITITFTPATLGFSNGTLLIDATTITLTGSGTQPPPLPAYTISGPTGTGAPLTQPNIGLTLASTYPVAISGTLTMTVTGNLPADPAVQFASGGRTVSFVIPANSTSAVFASLGTEIGIQTGTVASTVTLIPSFATQAGSVDLTPTSPLTLQFSVGSAAPSLIAVQVSNVTTTGLTIQLTGFATTRSVTSATVQFTAASGFSMPTSQFAVDLSQASTLWFQSTASQTYGGQFTISLPFTFQVKLPTGQTIANAIASVAVTTSNSVGASNSLQASLQ